MKKFFRWLKQKLMTPLVIEKTLIRSTEEVYKNGVQVYGQEAEEVKGELRRQEKRMDRMWEGMRRRFRNFGV